MARMERTVRKVVFPAAGLGTRFLPATKVIPKEMLVLVDKPVIQYGVEEALQSGVTDIAIVTSRGKSAGGKEVGEQGGSHLVTLSLLSCAQLSPCTCPSPIACRSHANMP